MFKPELWLHILFERRWKAGMSFLEYTIFPICIKEKLAQTATELCHGGNSSGVIKRRVKRASV